MTAPAHDPVDRDDAYQFTPGSGGEAASMRMKET
jgi:hypothetical protein